ncbi:hypothetical protein Ancab_010823 [Ancistrocladus abbreviatus]
MDRNRVSLFSCSLFSCTLLLLLCFPTTNAQSCRNQSFSNNKEFSSCNDLPVLNSFLYWTYNQSTRMADIAFLVNGVSTSNWVAWAINPTGSGMQGAQALVAFKNSSGAMHAYTSSVTSYGTQLAESKLSFSVSNISAKMPSSSQIIIFATVQVPNTTVNQVWQFGQVSGDTPQAHPLTGDHQKSKGTVNFLSGQISEGGGGGSRLRRKNVHGVLNAVGWGTLMPIGAIIARYMRVFKGADPAWFYLHITCQVSAYIVGVVGWGTGLKLGSESPGVYHTHRNIGITLFSLATLQVFALLLRPKKDHKYRLYWNIYHHSIGYTVIVLSIINVFKGLHILDPAKKWKRAYIGILIFLGSIALILEAFTWLIVLKRRRKGVASDRFSDSHTANGTNGYA